MYSYVLLQYYNIEKSSFNVFSIYLLYKFDLSLLI